jgi:putative ABC transport system permease protein
MLENLKIAVRHLWHNKLFSFINIMGLSLGLSCCFVILLHVKFETGFDDFHVNKDRIVRVLHDNYSYTPIVMATVMPEYFPEIEKIVRIGKFDWTRFYVIKDQEYFEEKDLMFADSCFFQLFSFPVLMGDPAGILRSPDRIMISESMSRKYYGTENPVGKTLTLRLINETHSFNIEGVFKDFPGQTHFHANMITSMNFFEKQVMGGQMFDNWGANSVTTYILMKQPGLMEAMTSRIPGFIDKYVPRDFARDLHYTLQPLTRIHLFSTDLTADIESQGSITRVLIFASIAILVLVIAVVNFVLLSLALSYQRIKEFGIRKIVGARQRELVSLVSAEFLIVFVLAGQISLMFVELAIPILEARMNFRVFEGVFSNAGLLVLFLLVVFLLGYLASLYITLNVSRIRPIDALKSSLPVKRSWIPSRGALIIFQFSIMTGLLVCLMIMHKQLWLVRNKDLGFRKDQLVTIDIPYNSGNKYQLLSEELKSISGVKAISGAVYVPPGRQWWATSVKNPETGESFQLEEINSDYGFVETLGIELVQGRSFSREFGSDTLAMLINESGLKLSGLKNPLESYLVRGEKDTLVSRRFIIGVFKDFHIRSLYEKIQPMAIFLSPQMVQQMAVRLNSGDNQATVKQIRKSWRKIFPDDPIQYYFVDEALRLNYLKEDQAHSVIGIFAFLSLVIALMGLFGLSSYAVERRTKETGIRRVNGAGIKDIFFALSKQFALWILIAFVIAVPASWYAMNRWLQHFAYRTGTSWWIFLLALMVSLLVAGITISWQTFKAARRNPVEALKYE